ncbi:MAG: hypothetical protein CO137_01415 [Candidatus Magasanikbacteria bacterium CG_4_9_14_3_um_filter_32_9]|uniref:Uncharacterized protein n=1 Tax=Candidatus Magasanikbacteria bacterium CG_4_9_14_3_um_filter_32_9 TaxID=1974644 RepID=A0A2M7Z7D7_9BACT|nr:MAG: hypothetical protein CO137_01415 [Candidatus Magasanikbacteria bacterium CG_4_9_14_3_um_filter_32_9]
MFWKKDNSIQWPFVILAIFLLVLVLCSSVIAFFLISGSSGSGQILDIITESTNSLDTVSTITGEEIKSNYLQEIANLKSRIKESNKSSEELLADTEYTFLNVSVPNELRDLHLKRFLEFKALEKQGLEKEELVSRLGVVLNSELTDFE